MKPLFMMIAVLATATVYAQGGGKPAAKKLERDGFSVEIPSAWGELPEVANNARNALLGQSTDMTGGAVAFGDPNAGVMALVFWVKTKDKVPGVRAALEGFHDEIKLSLEGNGTKLTTWNVTETTTRMTSAIEGSDGSVIVKGQVAGAVGKDGRLLGWSAQCIYGTAARKKAMPMCEALVSSFKVTVADADLKSIEAKKNK